MRVDGKELVLAIELLRATIKQSLVMSEIRSEMLQDLSFIEHILREYKDDIA